MTSETGTSDTETQMRDTFLGILAHDVMTAMKTQENQDSQASRRNLIRTMFVAVEGIVWEYRKDILSFVGDVGELNPLTALALEERSYSVLPNGKVEPQTRNISLPTLFRMATRLAEENCPDLTVDFTHHGWQFFQQLIRIRNRTIHPRTIADLEISRPDVKISTEGFFWILQTYQTVFKATLQTHRAFADDLAEFVQKLELGNPEAIAEYQAIIALQNSEDALS